MTRDELEKRAAAQGIKPQTLRMRMYREEQRQKAKSYTEPAFETFGLKLTPSFADEVREARKKLEAVALRVGTARLDVERLLKSKLPAPVKQLESLVGLILSLESRIAECMPRSLCPYCKGVDAIQGDCRSCAGTGLASVAQYNAAPRRLKDAPVVVSEGKEVALEDFSVAPRSGPLGEPA